MEGLIMVLMVLWKNFMSMIIVQIIVLVLMLLNLIELGDWSSMDSSVLMDALSIVMVVLTIWVCLVIFAFKGIGSDLLCSNLMKVIWGVLIFCFLMVNVFMFYIFFELVLIPMFLLIVMCGNYSERLEGSFYMLFYTMFGSMPLFLMIITNLKGLSWSLIYMNFMKSEVSISEFGGSSMVSAFLSKLPMYGVHIWLPKAHVEAPSVGSSILAGVLLKLGGYGIMRVLFFLKFNVVFKSLIIVMGLSGGVICGMTCIRQNDMKKLVAYSSVVHMGFMVAGLMTLFKEGWSGGMMMMVCHGLSSSGLFFFVNVIYERSGSRSMSLIKGCGSLCPSIMLWCFFLVVMNMGCPPFLGLLSEMFLLMGLLKWELNLVILTGMMMFITVGYNIYLYSVFNHGDNGMVIFESSVFQEYLLLFLYFWPSVLLVLKMEMFINI